MELILEFVLLFVIYVVIVAAAYYLTEVKKLPKWLQFKPFNCRTCCTFWSLLITYLAIGISFNLWGLVIGGVILAILTGIALKIDEKEKTVKLEDYGKLE